MSTIYQFILGFLAVAAFAYYLNVPKKAICSCAIGGGLGWAVFMYCSKSLNAAHIGVLIGAMIVGFMGEEFARRYHLPATVFIIAGIIPLVPGMNMYFMMYNIVMNDYAEAFRQGLNAAIIGGAISIGITLASGVYRRLPSRKSR